MSRRLKFADSFWGGDFTSTIGYDAICKRLKEGRDTCKAFEDYLKLRAKAEEEYGRALQKAIRCLADKPDAGSFHRAWDCLRTETDKMAADHLEHSTQFYDSANRMHDFVERQKNERTQKEMVLEKSIGDKKQLYRKCLEVKKQYELKSEDARNANEVYQRAKPQEDQYPTKEWDKLTKTLTKSTQEAQKAKQQYKECIDRLDMVRKEWERDMIAFCQTCEVLEEARINMLHNEIWLDCNITSMACVDDDRHCEAIRLMLEQVNSQEDIQLFIRQCATGIEKPLPIRFEEYDAGSFFPSGSTPSGTAHPGFISAPRPAPSPASRAAIPPPLLSPGSPLGAPPGRPPLPHLAELQQKPMTIRNRSYQHQQ